MGKVLISTDFPLPARSRTDDVVGTVRGPSAGLILITMSVLTFSPAIAQTFEDSIRYKEAQWSMAKKSIVLKFLSLTEADKPAFWSIYDSYSNASQYIEMEYFMIFHQYFAGVASGKKVNASAFGRLFRVEQQIARARRQYFRRFKKALSPEIAVRFMILDGEFRRELRGQVPVPDRIFTGREVDIVGKF